MQDILFLYTSHHIISNRNDLDDTLARTLAVLVALWGCLFTEGKSVRNSGNCFVIFPLIVRAAYSSFGDATQQGTMLWAST